MPFYAGREMAEDMFDLRNRNNKTKWQIKPTPELTPEFDEFRKQYSLSELGAKLLMSRGCDTPDSAYRFLMKDYLSDRDPFIMKDMDKAVTRIEHAIESGDETVAVFGDYDVDGVTSVSLMYLYLFSRGLRVGYYIPSRLEEGYGMSCAAIKKLKDKGVTLIITVDTGITAINEVEYAHSLGIDVIVTDHHECRPELPDAVAVVNPHRPDCEYPFKDFAGVGVAYKLVCALEYSRAEKAGESVDFAMHSVLLDYGDLVAIGTVADVMPLVDENRAIVSYGLIHIEKTGRCGVKALISAASGNGNASSRQSKKELNANFIGFTVAPRLNAAGRMGSASVAVELLLSDDEEEAAKIAEQLCEINRDRQAVENYIFNQALQKIENFEEYENGDKVIVISADDWHQGVIGIVASRLTERFGLPTILITFENMLTPGTESPMDVGKGSGRSVKGLDLVSALSACDDLLLRYGGHELAAGLSVTRGNLPFFRKKINEYAEESLPEEKLAVVFAADALIEPEQITLDFISELNYNLEPCGVGNTNPVFVMLDCKIVSARTVGNGKHLKLTVMKNGKKFHAMWFGHSGLPDFLDVDDMSDLMFNLSINNYAGETTVQLILTDVRIAQSYFDTRAAEMRRLDQILEGDVFRKSENILPTRQNFVDFYSTFFAKNDFVHLNPREMMKAINSRFGQRNDINFIKASLMLRVFEEAGLITGEIRKCCPYDHEVPEGFREEVWICNKVVRSDKADLEASPLLRSLRRQQIDS